MANRNSKPTNNLLLRVFKSVREKMMQAMICDSLSTLALLKNTHRGLYGRTFPFPVTWRSWCARRRRRELVQPVELVEQLALPSTG